MSLAPGTKLGPCEILASIGAGGMGEVYEARDARLERTVAVKILPEHLAGSSELHERFEREAKLITSRARSFRAGSPETPTTTCPPMERNS